SNNQTIKQSNNQTIKQSNNQTIKQSNNQTIKQSNNQTIKQSNNQTIKLKMSIKELEETINQQAAILVYFQNDHCPPCMSLRPKVETMAQVDFPKMNLTFIDSFKNPALTAHFGVFAHPTLLIFFDGKEYIRSSKYVSIPELKSKIQRPYTLLFD
ncbi:MAG: thioredoxin family protein, partial [Saprospiraceae bacterium]